MAKTITIMRHSKARAAQNGETDAMRPLSPEGVALAAKRHKTFQKPFGLGIVSKRLRTRQTLECAAGTNLEVLEFSELSEQDAETDALIDRVYARLKGNPLRPYLEDSEMAPVLRKFGTQGWKVILDAVHNSGAEDVLVVNHEVYSASILMAAVGWEGPFADLILDMLWPECHGVELVMDGDRVVNVLPLSEPK